MSNENTITDVRPMLGSPSTGGRITVVGSTMQGNLDENTVAALLGAYSPEEIATADPKYNDPLTTDPNEPLIGAYVDWPPGNNVDQGGTLVFSVADHDPGYLHQRNKDVLDRAQYGGL